MKYRLTVTLLTFAGKLYWAELKVSKQNADEIANGDG